MTSRYTTIDSMNKEFDEALENLVNGNDTTNGTNLKDDTFKSVLISDDITVLEAEPCDAGADFQVTLPDGPKPGYKETLSKILDPSMSVDELANRLGQRQPDPTETVDDDLTDDEKAVLLTAHKTPRGRWIVDIAGACSSLRGKGYAHCIGVNLWRLTEKGIDWVKANRPPITVAVCNAEGDDITVLKAERLDAGADFQVTLPGGPLPEPPTYRPATDEGMAVESKAEPDESVWNAHKRFSR